MKKSATVQAQAAAPQPIHGKYFLRSLHQEIDYFDRRIAYIDSEEFASPADREDAKKKIMLKRATLEKKAKDLAAAGVEFDQAELPRSFRAA